MYTVLLIFPDIDYSALICRKTRLHSLSKIIAIKCFVNWSEVQDTEFTTIKETNKNINGLEI